MVSLSQDKFRPSCVPPVKGQYCRILQLPPLLKVWPSEVEDYSYPGTLRIAALLRKALRSERCRARAGHWAYDLNRHMGLIEALKHERARLKLLERGLPHRAEAASGRRRAPHLAGTLRLPCLQKSARPPVNPGS
jgi:hypothetical protein